MKKIILLLGAPGSGKGTQAQTLVARYRYGHISTGDLLRALEADTQADSEDKRKLEQMRKGELVADDLIYKLAFNEIDRHFKLGHGVVLDGAIRTVEQAEAYDAFFDQHGLKDDIAVVFIKISDETTLERLLSRKRPDDTEEIIKHRIQEQGNPALMPIVEYYTNRGVLVTIDGEQSIDKVDRDIQDHIENSH